MPPLSATLFDYDLPPRLIAQVPAVRRDQSRLLVVDRATRAIAHRTFANLPEYLRAGDTLFRNNAAVLPARLHAHRPTGGKVECFLLRPVDGGQTWRCLVKPGKKLAVGATFAHPTGDFAGEILAKEADGSADVRFTTRSGEPISTVARRLGDVPLPPYIVRTDDSRRAEDFERYQTVYADRAHHEVAVAAPTAGLHFTPELLATLDTHGVRTAEITLHVGLGTFKPIATATVEEHQIHRELYELPVATQRALFPPFTGRRIAVGTTSVRSIEDFLSTHSAPTAPSLPAASSSNPPAVSLPNPSKGVPHVAEASLFIYPPRLFRGVDALITNFHQPRSTLLCLTAAFLTPGSTDGIAWLRELYAEAIAREYRFFSYGDALLIL